MLIIIIQRVAILRAFFCTVWRSLENDVPIGYSHLYFSVFECSSSDFSECLPSAEVICQPPPDIIRLYDITYSMVVVSVLLLSPEVSPCRYKKVSFCVCVCLCNSGGDGVG